MNDDSQICRWCHGEKPLIAFRHSYKTRNGYDTVCLQCSREYGRRYRTTTRGRAVHNRSSRKYYHMRKVRIARGESTSQRTYYYRADTATRKAQHAAYARRYMSAPERRLYQHVGYAVWNWLRGRKACQKWTALVGYSFDELMTRLKLQFQPGMTMENYGTVWHLDHIVARARFDLASDDAFKQCWALSNLMPRFATTEIALKYGSTQIGNLNKQDKILEATNGR